MSTLHRQGLVRTGDPERLEQRTMLRRLLATCQESGVELGAYDRQVLGWLCGWEPSTVQVVIGLVERAYEAGKAAR